MNGENQMSNATTTLKLLEYVEVFIELYLNIYNGSASMDDIIWILKKRYNLSPSDADTVVELAMEVMDV
jgi:hypothetical protein